MPAQAHKLSLAALLVACHGDDGGEEPGPGAPPELAFEYTTEDIAVHSDIARCAGDLTRWQGFVEFAQAYLGHSLSEPVELHVWQSEDFDGPRYCDNDWGGCFYRPRTIYTGDRVVEHELVHAITAQLGNRDSFFDEGLAEALSSATTFGQFAPAFPAGSSAEVDYASAGHFVRWLLESRGWSQLRAHLSEPGGVAEFEAVFGQELEELTQEFFASANPVYPRLYEHPIPSFDAAGDAIWASALEFDCEREDVRAASNGLEVVRELTLPRSGYYAFWSSVPGEVRGRARTVIEQGEGPLFSREFSLPGEQIAVGRLGAGTYEIGVVAPPGIEAGEIVVWEHFTGIPVPPGAAP